MNHDIDVIQLNVAGSHLRVHSMLNDKSYQAASILLVQDPWWGRIGYDKSIDPTSINIYGTTNSPFWMCFIPPGISGPKGPGVSIYVRRDVPGLHAQYSDILPPHPDILAVDIIYNGSITTLVNVYIHGDNKRYEDALNHLYRGFKISRALHYSGYSESASSAKQVLLWKAFQSNSGVSRASRGNLS
ncbi:hypothetical protein BN14_06085 [Rhizoctonia solani AG-1 IB]|uniref:Uncharacterized protein n=1 Tax=Thanatephorus cucumeris (strain AG1-IB / isolate 7/3/14) TaxID=1108050 RepID=M5BWL3_THACB|nr:hypothetical protein BN14_06085 [Rhizoctonia solani AG-1 IB]